MLARRPCIIEEPSGEAHALKEVADLADHAELAGMPRWPWHHAGLDAVDAKGGMLR